MSATSPQLTTTTKCHKEEEDREKEESMGIEEESWAERAEEERQKEKEGRMRADERQVTEVSVLGMNKDVDDEEADEEAELMDEEEWANEMVIDKDSRESQRVKPNHGC